MRIRVLDVGLSFRCLEGVNLDPSLSVSFSAQVFRLLFKRIGVSGGYQSFLAFGVKERSETSFLRKDRDAITVGKLCIWQTDMFPR